MKSSPLRIGLMGLAFAVLTFSAARAQDEPASEPPAAGQDSAGTQKDGPAAKEAPASAPTEGTPAGAAEASTAGEAYELKLRGLEERVNELKEKIFRTKARILQLQETMLTGSIGAGSRAILVHRNEMGGAFRLLSVQYALDTQPIFKKVDVSGDLDGIDEKEIFSGNIVPGNHNIAVQMAFQGQGFGFFSYVKGYKFKVTSSYTFTAEEGKIITVKIVAFERGGITTKLEERPAVRYDLKIEKLTPDRAKTLQEKAEEAS
ncbi:MAG: dihydrolipoamide acetyltransferase [Deltaproteobacteria bacterium]|nr:dihydrolipoamide acetyltransferase [Deltaproteobacteria bacterium]